MELFPALMKDKTKEFYKEFDLFMDNVLGSVSSLKKTIHAYCSSDKKAIAKNTEEVISFEKNADTIRREMEKTLYEGVLIPFGREDKHELMETIDDIADRSELVVRLLKSEKIESPQKLRRTIKSLADLIEECTEKLAHSVRLLKSDLNKAVEAARKVELMRENVRECEFLLIERLFSESKNNTFNMLLVKEIISLMGQVADKAEEASDRVIALAVKYRE